MVYATKQRKRLLEVLEAHPDVALSVPEISSLVSPEAISPSAIYRNLSSLEQEGFVKRVTLPLTQKIGYRYVGADKCKSHLHLECKKCGKTFHLPLEASERLIDGVKGDAGFEIDRTETVLLGACADCKKN